MIFQLVYNMANCEPIKRLFINGKFGDREGFENLKDGLMTIYIIPHFAECADWIVGINATGCFQFSSEKHCISASADTYACPLCDRHNKIAFSEKYFTVELTLGGAPETERA